MNLNKNKKLKLIKSGFSIYNGVPGSLATGNSQARLELVAKIMSFFRQIVIFPIFNK